MRAILPLLVLLASTLAVGASAQSVFEPPLIEPLPPVGAFVTTNPVLGDIDHDGDLDAVVTKGTTALAFVHTFINDGTGALTLGPGMAGFQSPMSAAMHDMNGDARPDYLLASDFVFVLWGDGDGLFTLRTNFSPVNGASRLAAGDVNGDAVPDIVLTTRGQPLFVAPARLQVWAENGGSYALLQSQQLSGTPSDLELADLNGDGLLDAVVARLDGAASWHVGEATGGFLGATALPGLAGARWVAPGDIDGDDDIDLVLGRAQPQVQPLLNDGAGTFTPGQIIPAGQGGAAPSLADIDSDGRMDIVLDDGGSGGVGQLVIWRGLGGGVFEEDVHVTAGASAAGQEPLVADLDGDARPDVFSATGGTAVYLNRTYESGSPFLDLGFALPGSNGYPVHIASGALTAGTPFSFRLLNGLPGAPATIVLGFNAAYLPFKGGVLVPSPDLLYPGFVMDAGGAFTLAGIWPPGLPPGSTGYLQWWFKDPEGPTLNAASSGLRFTTP